MTHAVRAHRTAAALFLVATAVFAAGCTSQATSGASGRPAAPDQSASVAASASAAASDPDGSTAEVILKQAFMDRVPLGSGFGRLQQQIGNTLAGTPDDVRSVTFAFTCTGGATATLRIRAGEDGAPSAAGTHTCDGTVFQSSVKLAKPEAVSFQADITGSYDGSFAYAYHAEQKQLG